MDSSAASAATGAVALLDLPLRSTVGVDGHVIVLQRDDFAGVFGVPSDSRFHLFTARASSSTENQTLSALTCGFVVLPARESEWIVARKYDPQTEEVGSEPLDSLTTENLVKQVQRGQMQQRVVPYNSVLSAPEIDNWRSQTNFISQRLLEKRGLSHGDKVIPGCFEDDMVDESTSNKVADGKPLVFPPIPVLDDSNKLKRTSHVGTKRYLAQLSPSDRTTVFLDELPADRAFSGVLARNYDNSWEEFLGDIQLSYTMFLHIQCLSSLEHWRDLVAMSSTVSSSMVDRNIDLYLNLLRTLEIQVTTMEQDFFEDIEFSGDNFFVPAIKRLCSTCSQASNNRMADDVSALTKTLTSRFGSFHEESNGKQQSEAEEFNNHVRISGMDEVKDDAMMSGGSDSDSGPIVVPSDEVEASFARSSQRLRPNVPSNPLEYSEKDQRTYQLLFAAKMEHEDILMTCARILDEKNDVSLVREAAAYLEEVEAKRAVEP